MSADSQAAAFNLLLVDDHIIVIEGLKHILAPIAGQWHIGQALDGFEALECMRHRRFNLVITDLSMPGLNGLNLIRRIRAEHPSVLILVLSMHGEEQYALRAFKAGANGYVTKDSAPTELIQAVRKVLAGGTYVSASLAECVIAQIQDGGQGSDLARLSDRELDILRRFVAGQRPTDVAKALHLSIKTVSSHKSRIQEKLGLPTMAALIRYGLEHQLDPGEVELGRARAKGAGPLG